MDEVQVGRTAVRAVLGDITTAEVDAVVNAANEHLVHGGGVAAAIARAGGRAIVEESLAWVREHGPVPPGEAVVTTAGTMAADVVVHVVGPRYRAGHRNEELLREAVDAALDAAAGAGARSVALPAISAGIFGYPRQEATRVIAAEVGRWAGDRPDALDLVLLVGYDQGTADDFRSALGAL